MSTKEWVSEPTDGVGVYQDCIYDWDNHVVNPNPAVIQLDHSANTTVTQKFINDKLASQFTMEVTIPAKKFDKIAIEWCRKRSLNTNKYSVDELLSKCNPPQYYLADESTEAFEEALDDLTLTQIIDERNEQPEIDADLVMNNIFNILATDPLEARYMLESSNELIQLREAGRNLTQKFPILTKISSEDEHAKALMMMEVLLGDYDNNLLLIDALSCSVARFDADE
ncbi:hypothetical protein ACFOEW_15750 [Alteromonas oceani]|uniref:Uncharacterized protein n=1 Tax=Alteromonas oceani TaxID=2071609 RepID=A0ABV7JZT2_9ALTE|nr:hypothetical protein [Alteromonas oceani]|tara:strand:- start:84 stop:761 length:678 start_codon:yes stop_codon:yes gene_type:complete